MMPIMQKEKGKLKAESIKKKICQKPSKQHKKKENRNYNQYTSAMPRIFVEGIIKMRKLTET